MISILLRAGQKSRPAILFAVAAALLMGCNSNQMPTPKPMDANRITAIRINEEDRTWNCIINGDNPLVFSAVNHLAPSGVVLYFPNTSLNVPQPPAIAPENELFESIRAEEFLDGTAKNSRIFISLKIDRPYVLSPAASGLKISFPKTLAEPDIRPAASDSDKRDAAAAGSSVLTPVTSLKAVSATPMQDYLIVDLKADRPITDYESFALENPARIVFDIFQIQTPDIESQTIAVDSPWVQQIRYTPYPNRIRLVLDLPTRSAKSYFSFPTATGMLIYVGRLPEPLRTP